MEATGMKPEDERESFLALVSKTRTELLKAFPPHEVPDRVENCRNAFFWMWQHLHGTGVAKCLQDLEIALDILTTINLTDLDAAPDRRIVTGLPLRMQGVKCGLSNNTKQEFLHAEELMALFMPVSQAHQGFTWAGMGTWFDIFFAAVHEGRVDVNLRTGEFHVDFGDSNISCSG